MQDFLELSVSDGLGFRAPGTSQIRGGYGGPMCSLDEIDIDLIDHNMTIRNIMGSKFRGRGSQNPHGMIRSLPPAISLVL